MHPTLAGTPVTPGSAAGSAAGSSLMGGGLQTPSTPRIDISRASSSSHHDSHDSSPERELYGEVIAEGGSTLGLGFKEEGTADLRSSTEELNFHTETGTVQEREFLRRKQKQLSKLSASNVFKYELDAQNDNERKDSNCSELGLLSISGRTSRLSSIGSAASGGSGVSHISNVSRLSVTSHFSGVSGRSTSPHKMLVETSFCGSTPSINQSVDIATPPTSTKHEPRDTLEKILLAKSVDPTMAIVAGGVESADSRTVSESCALVNGTGRLAESKVRGAEDAVSSGEPVRRPERERSKRLGQTEGIYMRETEGKFISLKFDSFGNSIDVEEMPTQVPKGGKRGKKAAASESEGTYISLKGEPDSLQKDVKPAGRPLSARASSKGGQYLQETEGKFISLKYSQDSQDGEDFQPAARSVSSAKKSSETEGRFISLKHSQDSQDGEEIQPTKRSAKKSSETEGRFISLKHSHDSEDGEEIQPARRSGKKSCETEGKFISLKHSHDSQDGEEIQLPKRSAKKSSETEGRFISLKHSHDSQDGEEIQPVKRSAKKSSETEGRFISLKHSQDSQDGEEIQPAKRSAKKSLETEGRFISLKHSQDSQDGEEIQPAKRSAKKSSETEGRFISLKHSHDSQDGEEIQPAQKSVNRTKQSSGANESEGTFISLKSDSLDKETVATERPRSRSPRLASVTKACIEADAKQNPTLERRTDKSKLNNGETEGTYISLKPEPEMPRVNEVKVEAKRPKEVPQKLAARPKIDAAQIVASMKVDKISAKPKERTERTLANAPKRVSKPIDFQNIPPEGIFISLKPGFSLEEEERIAEKAPPLKDCGKSSRLRDNEGSYMRETEGTFISLKGDLSSSLDREERGVEIPVTLNLTEAGKSGKTVQSFSQLVKDVSRPSKDAAKPLSVTPAASPKPARHAVLRKDEVGSRTPSPSSSSRKSSFTSLFRRGDVLSPESPSIGKARKPGFTAMLKEAGEGLIERNRSRSKSKEPPEASSASVSPLTVGEARDAKLKRDAKNKNVFTTLFKKKERKRDAANEETLSPAEVSSPEPTLPVHDAISNVEFTFAADRQSELPAAVNLTTMEPTLLASNSSLPSESVMLPTLSQLYRDHKETSAEKPKDPDPALLDRPKKPARENVDDASRCSSESERDFEVESIGAKTEELLAAEADEEDHERKGIFSQQDSVDEELPYVPTTLPQERSIVVPLVPAKQRALAEVRTCPVERPRSTTPINPSLLDEFVSSGPPLGRELKMKISLPREDSISSKKSPRRSHTRSWFEFAEQGLQSPREYRKGSLTSATSPSPPPLPPRASTAAVSPPPQLPPLPKVQNWINFEEIPEKRKPPKRIQTIPSRSNIEFPEPSKTADGKGVQYSYVNPEDCKCECHESSARHGASGGDKTVADGNRQRCAHSENKRPLPRLEVEDKHSCVSVSDSSCAYVNPYAAAAGEEFNLESLKVMKPFGMDLDISSNRSSVVSQDEQPSPDNELPRHVH